MSLSSKELFHSNFWAWLIERNIEYAKIFFPDDLSRDPQDDNLVLAPLDNVAKVEREEGHRDVTVWRKEIPARQKNGNTKYDEAFVIENKFKSIPTMDQLLRYQEVLEKPKDSDGNCKEKEKKIFCRGLLTGLERPDFMDDPKLLKWKFLSYDEIGKRIIEVAKRVEAPDEACATEVPFEQTLIIQYGEMIRNLHALLHGKLDSLGEYWKTFDADCEMLRINDIFSKLVAARLEKYLRDRLLGQVLPEEIGDYELRIEAYYAQNGAGVDVRYVIPDKNLYVDGKRPPVKEKFKEKVQVLGIQIEGSQYRWCAQSAEYLGKYVPKTDAFFEKFHIGGKACKYGWFVDYDHTKFKEKEVKKIEDRRAGMMRKTGMSAVKGKTKSYPYRLYAAEGKGAYTFLYQYWTLGKETEEELFSFAELLEHIKRDMLVALEIIRKA